MEAGLLVPLAASTGKVAKQRMIEETADLCTGAYDLVDELWR